MFGPNNIPDIHHREQAFKDTFAEADTILKDILGMNENDILLFVTGSGTLANEIVLSSLKQKPTVSTQGAFSERLSLLSQSHSYSICFDTNVVSAGVKYETGVSRVNSLEGVFFADCISALPYYQTPKSSVFTTVLSKQFGLRCGMSLIGIREPENTLKYFKDKHYSYLSLINYVDRYYEWQTPNTPAIDSFIEVVDKLAYFDVNKFRSLIDARREKIIHALRGFEEVSIVGEGPVLTLRGLDTEVCMEYNIYMNSGAPQIFLWSGTDEQYEKFVNYLRKVCYEKRVLESSIGWV